MGSYVQSALTNGEQIAYEGKVSLWSLAPLFIIGLLLLPFWGIGLLFWISAAIKYFTTVNLRDTHPDCCPPRLASNPGQASLRAGGWVFDAPNREVRALMLANEKTNWRRRHGHHQNK
ncbi:MAG: hypothetical protein RBR77_13330 [Thauera sp.]|jgi:hypothetical protein|nr:hypothetical protein [Thauera sp.]